MKKCKYCDFAYDDATEDLIIQNFLYKKTNQLRHHAWDGVYVAETAGLN